MVLKRVLETLRLRISSSSKGKTMVTINEVSEAGFDLIKSREKFEPKVYVCPAGKDTIGYGTTFYPNGKPVRKGDPAIDEPTAVKYMKAHIEKNSLPIINKYVTVPLNPNQAGALVSFVYNTGGGYIDKAGKWQPFKLYALINSRASEAELREYWENCAIKGGGVVLRGLVDRRKDEVDLFFS